MGNRSRRLLPRRAGTKIAKVFVCWNRILMNFMKATPFLLGIILAGAIAAEASPPPAPAPEKLESGFESPADAFKPHIWWHWMNGHVTKEGITRDLEDMKRIGYGGFTIWNTHEGIPKGPVEFASEDWWAMLEHTMDEAERLGLEMGIFNGAGWSQTGAPFVTPDKAMQEVAWTEAKVTGPGKVRVKLEVPVAALGIERDMQRDPVINRRYYMPREHVEGWFRDIAVFAVPAIPAGQEPWTLNDWRYKAGFGKLAHRFQPDMREAPADQVIAVDQILDISKFMNAEGELEWVAPAGEWTILRMGHQPTGRNNHPASHGGRGLEIDKMSAEAVDFYWENFLDRVVATAGDRIGKTFMNIITDSFEVGHQNWNQDFAESFIAAMGYDIRPFLPVVAGRIVGSVEFSERILWDYRKVIGDLVVQNYFGRMHERCRAAGLLYGSEPFGTYGNTNDYAAAGTADVPTCEFWAFQTGRIGRLGEAKMAASAGHTYGRRLVDAEAFTGMASRIFETHPDMMKAQGDFYMAMGVNRFSFHSWVHDPYGVVPGLGLGTYGSRFDNRNTWWPFSQPWHEYLTRCFFLLQQGEFVGDVLYFVGDEAPLRSEGLLREKILPDLPASIDHAFANEEILRQLRVEDGWLKTPHGSRFRVLVLPPTPWMSVSLLEKTAALLADGAVVVGPKPVSPPGKRTPAETARFDALVHQLWGDWDGASAFSRKVGKGMLHADVPLDQVLVQHGIEPDFSFTHQGDKPERPPPHRGSDIEFIHRRAGSDEIYFLSNQIPEEVAVTASFRVTGKVAEIWLPETGTIHKPAGVRTTDTHTELPLRFGPNESCLVIFRDAAHASATEPPPWSRSETVVADLSEGWTLAFPDGASVEMPALLSWTDLTDDAHRHHSGTATYRKLIDWRKPADGSRFFLDLGEVRVIARVEVNGIDCGIAWKRPYRVDLTEALKPGGNIIEVTVANLWVNRILGDQRFPDDVEWTTDTDSTAAGMGLARIPDWVKSGGPRPEPRRKAFHAWKWPHLTAEKKLLPSGMLGPVRIVERR